LSNRELYDILLPKNMTIILVVRATILMTAVSIVSDAAAVPPSAGSILSQERQERSKNSIEKMRPTPPDDETGAAVESDSKFEVQPPKPRVEVERSDDADFSKVGSGESR